MSRYVSNFFSAEDEVAHAIYCSWRKKFSSYWRPCKNENILIFIYAEK
jgi:hypothetical protein